MSHFARLFGKNLVESKQSSNNSLQAVLYKITQFKNDKTIRMIRKTYHQLFEMYLQYSRLISRLVISAQSDHKSKVLCRALKDNWNIIQLNVSVGFRLVRSVGHKITPLVFYHKIPLFRIFTVAGERGATRDFRFEKI